MLSLLLEYSNITMSTLADEIADLKAKIEGYETELAIYKAEYLNASTSETRKNKLEELINTQKQLIASRSNYLTELKVEARAGTTVAPAGMFSGTACLRLAIAGLILAFH